MLFLSPTCSLFAKEMQKTGKNAKAMPTDSDRCVIKYHFMTFKL